MTALLWDRTRPYRCACGDSYQPVLDRHGKLVKSRDPAWKMMEQVPRDKGCLQELCRFLSGIYKLNYQHHSTSKGSGAGYPDVHLWTPLRADGGGGSGYAELKRMGRDPTDVQCEVMATLQDATPGRRVYLVRSCCVLTGTVDELMAELAGTRSYDVRDGRAFTPVEVLPGAPIARLPQPQAPAAPPASTQAPMPGTDPEPFAPAVGIVVPLPTTDPAAEGMRELEDWLRTAGFVPTDYPYPVRLVTGAGRVHVHCRRGPARPGNDVRVWRGGVPAREFPEHLAAAVNATVIAAVSSSDAAATIEPGPVVHRAIAPLSQPRPDAYGLAANPS